MDGRTGTGRERDTGPRTPIHWVAVIPLKAGRGAKSRLGATLGERARASLAPALARDTVAAVLACRSVREVIVVTDEGWSAGAPGVRVVPDVPNRGLNAAVEHGVRVARATSHRHLGGDAARMGVVALNGDLPALRPEELERVLLAARAPRCFVADAEGTGTTMLTVAPDAVPEPRFGPGSRMRHRESGALELVLPDVPGARRDVDTGADLLVALGLGVGPHTRRAWEALRTRDRERGEPGGPGAGPGLRRSAGSPG
ncbi:2-phospho-L-lactate guanylyltransferase [Streptomyces calidiresistens]|uniref:Phosphoenolpyruvate guanylyltransferase n=1 Tax=Streptomyces calidiresistens TaxID=1485586 RepID=A0A7W3T2T3_9ACTN|nr:2-phospho-L-lactate guanylyltransferase [Streptomyces calidiresistens]MBB0229902.1 2-phospho-L-lactate guanylyltransferase [Streptomyces calidiresistens]